MNKALLEDKLKNYLPEAIVSTAAQWVIDFKVNLTITKARSSKLGDYRSPFGGDGHRISINHNLNKYSFLITFIHELAHLCTFNKYGNRVAPHGNEWKEEFKILMREVIKYPVFPKKVFDALVRYMQDPAASSCVDENLQKILLQYDQIPKNLVDDLPHGTVFKLENGMVFKKGPKVRKNYECLELRTNRIYRVSPIATAQVLDIKSEGEKTKD